MQETENVATADEVGRTIAQHVARCDDPRGVYVRFPFSLLACDNYSAQRPKPRLTVRDQFRIVDLNRRPCGAWYEGAHDTPSLSTGSSHAPLPERNRTFDYEQAPELYPTRARVPVPEGLLSDPEALASFVALRVIPRLFTAENEALICGSRGLLNHPQVCDLGSFDHGFSAAPIAACEAVEQAGSTPVGMFLNPYDYWQLRGSSRVIDSIEAGGVRITRTRLTDKDRGIVGDFDFGVRLFESGSSEVWLEEPSAEDPSRCEAILIAEFSERLVVGLPLHIFRFTVDPR